MSNLLTRDEAVDVLAKAGCRVSPRTLANWARSGHLKPVRLGPRFVRYRAADIVRMIGSDTE